MTGKQICLAWMAGIALTGLSVSADAQNNAYRYDPPVVPKSGPSNDPQAETIWNSGRQMQDGGAGYVGAGKPLQMPWQAPGGTSSGSPGVAEPPPEMEQGDAQIPPMPEPACEFSQWVGSAVDEEAVKATGRPYRILPPGSMATMDYSAARINVHTDEDGIVVEVTCG